MHELLEHNRSAILEIAKRRGAYDLRVFGSMVRGDAGPESDVDLLVKMEEGRTGLDLGGLLMDLQDLLGRRVDLVTEAALSPKIRRRVLQQAEYL
jgi:predicted nucleotidyltransferase